ncbi:MAG: 16S rRNA (guanine(527)-N(7))-methyltransferase RsmG [Bacteroidetes bacterium]|nr:16S rRNA (guanine(527)-N(7))-methyltransferase RsmG [Bacteroidota bacterium]
MVGAEIIFKHFPELSEKQKQRFLQLETLYKEHNQRVNVISRKDMDMFYLHHVLHSLALAKAFEFPTGSEVIDIGTGGGFPGIPLTILFPNVEFTLCDSIGKKVAVVTDVIEKLGLKNATAVNSRTETLNKHFDIATARAVAPMLQLWTWMQGKWNHKPCFYLLKGGDLTKEITELLKIKSSLKVQKQSISQWYEEPFFETKKVISIYA